VIWGQSRAGRAAQRSMTSAGRPAWAAELPLVLPPSSPSAVLAAPAVAGGGASRLYRQSELEARVARQLCTAAASAPTSAGVYG
jgi:hypothetical protein